MRMDRLATNPNMPFLLAISLCFLLFTGCQHRKTKPVEAPSLVTEKDRLRPLVIIDAGHGGKDTGACNHQVKIIEKNLSLKTAKLVQKYLEEMGYTTFMMRTRDEFIDLDKRVTIARGKAGSILVSLHFNSAKNRHAHGIEIFYYDDPEDSSRHARSLRLSELILKETTQMTGALSRGSKPAAFRVIKNTNMPACLIEGGFITHAREAKRLASTRYLEKLARGIASGINLYCGSAHTRKPASAKLPVKPQAKLDIDSLKSDPKTNPKSLKPALEKISPR